MQKVIGNEPLMLTFGGSLSNLDIKELVDFHKKNNKLCTATSVKPSGHFGVLQIKNESLVESFHE